MSADLELMKLAAKAIGEEVTGIASAGFGEDAATIGLFLHKQEMSWNPLTDDGDAMRLAASLRLHIKPGKHVGDGCTVETQRDGIAGCTAFYDDKNQQMRQAIVRAAAEIGKAMP